MWPDNLGATLPRPWIISRIKYRNLVYSDNLGTTLPRSWIISRIKYRNRGVWCRSRMVPVLWHGILKKKTSLKQGVLRPFFMRDLFFLGGKQSFFFASSSFLPRKARKSTRPFSERVWLLSERCPDQFSAFVNRESTQLREFRTSSFFYFLARKKKLVKQSPHSVQLPLGWLDNWKMS